MFTDIKIHYKHTHKQQHNKAWEETISSHSLKYINITLTYNSKYTLSRQQEHKLKTVQYKNRDIMATKSTLRGQTLRLQLSFVECFPLSAEQDNVSRLWRSFFFCLYECVSHTFQVTQRLCSAAETRAKVQSSVQTLHPRHKRLQEPDSYTVSLRHISSQPQCKRKTKRPKQLKPVPCLVLTPPPPGGAVRETPQPGHRDPKRQLRQQQLPLSQLKIMLHSCSVVISCFHLSLVP